MRTRFFDGRTEQYRPGPGRPAQRPEDVAATRAHGAAAAPGLRGARARRRVLDGAVLAVTDVLVLRALGLGDLLTSVAALRGLRRAWPGARLVLAAPAGPGRLAGVPGGGRRRRARCAACDDGAGAGRARLAAPDVAVNLHGRGPQSHRLLAGLRRPAARRLRLPRGRARRRAALAGRRARGRPLGPPVAVGRGRTPRRGPAAARRRASGSDHVVRAPRSGLGVAALAGRALGARWPPRSPRRATGWSSPAPPRRPGSCARWRPAPRRGGRLRAPRPGRPGPPRRHRGARAQR